MKIEDIKKMARAWNQVQEASYGKKKEAMDPVDAKELKGKHKDRKDKDIDNDGDVDKSDEYLHKRRKAVSKAIKGKESETEVQTQESVELDENKMLAPAFHRVIKAHKYESDASGKNHTWPQGDRSTKIKHNGTHVVTYNQHDGSKVHKTPASLNRHLNALHDHEVDMKSVQESVEDMDEGSIKGSGTDRKAVLKKAYRSGEQKTRDFYKGTITPAPKTSDKGIKKAFDKGTGSNDGSSAAKGAARSTSQDTLRGTEHGRSEPSNSGKTHYKTQTHSSKMSSIRNAKKGKLPESVEELDELSKKTLGNYVKKSAADMSSKDSLDMHKGAMKRYKGIVKATDKLTKEAKDHGNMNNGSPAGEGLSPSAKKELANKTPMNPATDQPTVDKKTFDAIRASGKKAPMRSNDNAQGDKTPPKTGK